MFYTRSIPSPGKTRVGCHDGFGRRVSRKRPGPGKSKRSAMFRVLFVAIFSCIGGQALMLHRFGIAALAILIGACLLGWHPKPR